MCEGFENYLSLSINDLNLISYMHFLKNYCLFFDILSTICMYVCM